MIRFNKASITELEKKNVIECNGKQYLIRRWKIYLQSL